MNLVDNLDKIRDKPFLLLLGVALLLASGLQVIFFFNYDLFINLEVIKLVLLSFTFGLGINILPFLVISVLISLDKELSKSIHGDSVPLAFTISALFSYLVSGVPLVIAYFFTLSFQIYIYLIFLIPIVLSSLLLLIKFYFKYVKK